MTNLYRFHTYLSREAPVAGEIGFMSDLEKVDWDVADGDAFYVLVPYTMWGDYSGGTVERSNGRVLWDNYSDILVRFIGDWGSEFLALPVVGVDEELTERYEALEYDVERLDNYPVVDEDDMTQLEQELITEAIDDYLIADLRREFPDVDEDVLREKVQEYLQDGNEYPYCENAVGSVVFPGVEDWIRSSVGVEA